MAERTDEREPSEADLENLEGSGSAGDVDLSELEGAAGTGASADADTGVGLDDDELGVDVDALTAEPGTRTGTGTATGRSRDDGSGPTESESGLGERLRPEIGLGSLVRNPLPSLPSPRSFAVSLLVTVSFMFVVGSLVPLPASGLLGVFAGAFAMGAVSGRRRYLELLVSGAVAAGLSLVVGSLTLAALAGLAVPLAAFGASGGALAGLLGHYFGRDLRDGLTRDV